jgi:hypothetical protein
VKKIISSTSYTLKYIGKVCRVKKIISSTSYTQKYIGKVYIGGKFISSTSSDYSSARAQHFKRENHGYFRYDLTNGGPMSQQVLHVKEPLLLKAISV